MVLDYANVTPSYIHFDPTDHRTANRGNVLKESPYKHVPDGVVAARGDADKTEERGTKATILDSTETNDEGPTCYNSGVSVEITVKPSLKEQPHGATSIKN